MRLEGRKGKLVIYCNYDEKDFPKSLKCRWDNKLKGWWLAPSVLTYKIILEQARRQNVSLQVAEDLRIFFETKLKDIMDSSCNQTFKTTPFKHQERVTSLILQKRKCFVFAGVGTGKSKAAIDAITVLHNNAGLKKCLVVSPASIMWNFGNEITTHSFLDYTVIYGTLSKRKQLLNDSNTVFDILNYEMVGKLEKEIIAKNYDAVVFDEVHYLKNRNSERSKSAYKALSGIKNKVGLTGTIISNNYEDLFMPYKIVDEHIFGPHFTKFKERYFIMANWSGYDEVIGFQNENEIKDLISHNSIKFSIRDVIDSLPPEQNIQNSLELNNESMKMYKELKTHMMLESDQGDIVASNVLERMLRLSQITSGFIKNKETDEIIDLGNDKINALKDIIEQVPEKVVIFCRFTHSIDRVAKMCESIGKSYYIYDGRTKEKDLYLKFNNDDTNVWISQIQKSEGYSLPSAKYCIFYELDYSRKNHVQSRGRILRATGSKHDCIFYMYLIAKGTIDEVVYRTLQEKDFNSKQALEFVKGVE